MPIAKSLTHPLRTASYFFRVPAWVRHFAYEIDRVGLTQLALQSDGPFARPRDMQFVLRDFTSRRAVENAIYIIEQQAWECTEKPQPNAPGTIMIECHKSEYIVDEETYVHDAAFFNRIANLYEARNSGWLAGGVKAAQTSRSRRWLPILLLMFVMFSAGAVLLGDLDGSQQGNVVTLTPERVIVYSLSND